MTPNALATAVLVCWPAVVLAAFALRRSSSSVARTTAWMAFLAVMFLPPKTRFHLPLFWLDKGRIAMLSIWIALLLFHARELRARRPPTRFPWLGLAAFALGAIQTVRTNQDVLTYGRVVLPALDMKDAVRITISFFLDMCLPFLVGLRVFRTRRDLRDLLDVLGWCGLVYVPLCLFEMKMSPQLNHWIYGFEAGSIAQAARGWVWRPIVFMENGLAVATFLFASLVASLALHKESLDAGSRSSRLRTVVVGAVLALSTSFGAIVFAIIAVPVRLLLSSRGVARVAAALGLAVILMMAARVEDVFPTQALVDAAARVEPARAQSLAFRLRHENGLLARASERPMFGWGYWSRGFVYSPEGAYESVTDGMWIVYLTSHGYVGVAVLFSFLLVPVFLLSLRWSALSPGARRLASSLALVVAFFAVDCIPNSIFNPLPFLFAGVVYRIAAEAARARVRRRLRFPGRQVTSPSIAAAGGVDANPFPVRSP